MAWYEIVTDSVKTGWIGLTSWASKEENHWKYKPRPCDSSADIRYFLSGEQRWARRGRWREILLDMLLLREKKVITIQSALCICCTKRGNTEQKQWPDAHWMRWQEPAPGLAAPRSLRLASYKKESFLRLSMSEICLSKSVWWKQHIWRQLIWWKTIWR